MAKKEKVAKPKKGKTVKLQNPIKIMMGWLEAENAKDARAYVRGVIQQRFLAHEESWFATVPFQGGFLWEAHEGGLGKGYLKSVVTALDVDPGGEHWFKAGDRAYRIVMQDGKPFPHLLPTDKSIAIFNSGTIPLEPKSQMTPYVLKGTGWLASGIALSGTALAFFAGSLVFYGLAYNPGPSVRAVEASTMPHTKWPLVANTGIEEIVQKLQMMPGGQWSVDKRQHVVEGLDRLRKQREDLERANKERQLVEENQQKAADAQSDIADEQLLKQTINEALQKRNGETPAQEGVVEPNQAVQQPPNIDAETGEDRYVIPVAPPQTQNGVTP